MILRPCAFHRYSNILRCAETLDILIKGLKFCAEYTITKHKNKNTVEKRRISDKIRMLFKEKDTEREGRNANKEKYKI